MKNIEMIHKCFIDFWGFWLLLLHNADISYAALT